jgi:NADPH-dependent ferric siderophore reductase
MTAEQPQAARRVRPKPRLASIRRVERLTPGCVRIILAGEELEGYTSRGPAEHIKVLLPPPGERRLLLPEWGPEGPLLVEGQVMPPSRTYTPRVWDAFNGELSVDFMLHGRGLASDWVQQARAGDVVGISGPGGAYAVDPTAAWYLIAADESALPAAATLLEALPTGMQTEVILEVPGPGEEQPLKSAGDGTESSRTVTWLHRDQNGSAGALLEETLRRRTFAAGSGRIWLGCEASIMRNIRRHLIDERGMDRAHMHTHGYWKLGASNHPDHDIGQEI